MILLIVGLPGSGKTTLAKELVEGLEASWIDGDSFRRRFHPDLGWSSEARKKNLHRAGVLAGYLSEKGHVVASFCAPSEEDREAFKKATGGKVIVLWVDRPSKDRPQWLIDRVREDWEDPRRAIRITWERIGEEAAD